MRKNLKIKKWKATVTVDLLLQKQYLLQCNKTPLEMSKSTVLKKKNIISHFYVHSEKVV